MSTLFVSPLLRRALQADAAASLVAGLGMTLGAGLLESLLSLPASLLVPAGLVLFPWAAALYWMSRRPALPAGAVWAVILINALWVVDSAWVSLGGTFQPNALGHAFIALQALGVMVLIELEFMGMRRPGPALAA